jgi:hypothetical protein
MARIAGTRGPKHMEPEAISAPDLIAAERSQSNSPLQSKSSPDLFPSNRSSALFESGTSRHSVPTTSLLAHKILRTKQA